MNKVQRHVIDWEKYWQNVGQIESIIQPPPNAYTLRRKGKQPKEKSTNDMSKSFTEVEIQILNESMHSQVYS